MKLLCSLGAVWILGCGSSQGQSNACTCGPKPFYLEPMHLRAAERAKADQPAETSPVQTPSPKPTTPLSLATGWSGAQFHSRVLREGEFYLIPPPLLADSPAARFVDTVFRPEVFHLGKVAVSSPIATVIRRKNPLSLLSGLSGGPTGSGNGGICFRLLELSW